MAREPKKKRDMSFEANGGDAMEVRLDGCRGAKLMQVIITTALRGAGHMLSPFRVVTQVWTAEGELIAEHDPMPGGVQHGEVYAFVDT